MTDKIYNIPAGCAFAEVLAEKFLNEYRGRDLELTESPCRKSFERCFCAFAGNSTDSFAANAADWRCGRRRAVFDRV